MHVQYVVLCDQVVLSTDGKPSLIGIFNDVQAPAVPFPLPRMAFAARLLFTAEEAGGTRRVEVVIKDPAGGELTLPPAPPGADSLSVDIPVQFDLFEIGAFGRYTFLLHVDGAAVSAVQLSVRQAPMLA